MTDDATATGFMEMLMTICLTPAQRQQILRPPFPWFGGKSRVAPLVWERFGNVPNYVEPFFGSGAMLFHRPHAPGTETINDKDGFVANFWRAVQHDPEQVAFFADNPVNENDLHARHLWLLKQQEDFIPRLEGGPDFYDAKIAGWWVWGICCWIGGEFCSGKGPWSTDESGRLVHRGNAPLQPGTLGQGIRRRLVHLGDAGKGINRKRVHLGNAGQGVHRPDQSLAAYFSAFTARLRNVRVCCGDWRRVLGDSPTVNHGLTGIFMDPPYSAEANRDLAIYREEDTQIAHTVREWAIANGTNPLLRIALCGYEDEHAMPASWSKVKWKAHGGYGSQGTGQASVNAAREVIWFSPACLTPRQQDLFSQPTDTTGGSTCPPASKY